MILRLIHMERNQNVLDTPVTPLPNPGEGGPVYSGDDDSQIPAIPLPNPGEGGPVYSGDDDNCAASRDPPAQSRRGRPGLPRFGRQRADSRDSSAQSGRRRPGLPRRLHSTRSTDSAPAHGYICRRPLLERGLRPIRLSASTWTTAVRPDCSTSRRSRPMSALPRAIKP